MSELERIRELERRSNGFAETLGDVKGDVKVVVSEVRGLHEDLGEIRSEMEKDLGEIRSDLDELIKTLADEKRERRNERTTLTTTRWQRLGVLLAVMMWMITTTVTIGVAAGWFGGGAGP